MENQTTAPAQGKMERKFTLLYNGRKPVMLSSYELSMVIMAMNEELNVWNRMIKNVSTDEERYDYLEIKLHRSGLLARLEAMKEELFPLPF
jgi:hypothetical protein